MPASPDTRNLGSPEMSEAVREAVKEVFAKNPKAWTVTVVGAQNNDTWHITASDGQNTWSRDLHSGEHSVENVVAFLKAVVV